MRSVFVIFCRYPTKLKRFGLCLALNVLSDIEQKFTYLIELIRRIMNASINARTREICGLLH